MKPIATRRTSHPALALLAGLTLGACVGTAEDATGDDDDDVAYSVAGELSWAQCAKQGEWCAFTGRRFVRFGAGSRWVTRTFSNGVECSNRAFGARLGERNSCQIIAPDTADAGHSGMGMGYAGMNTGDAGMDMGSMAGMGPAIDMSKIPAGNPGVADVQLRATSEQPGASDGTGAFRTRCEYSHMLKDDPIVYPGRAGASHLHAFFGNTGANASSTHDTLRNSGNSTCRGGIANRTAYWVPSVVDRSGAPLKPAYADFYYKTGYNGIHPGSVRPFPSGLRMIAGDATSSGAQSSAYWGCHNHYIGHPASIPNCPAGDDVVMYVVFPQCWDGVRLDSPDHKSHMAYPRNGACPSTHPVAIPEITFNIYYPQPAGGTAGWRLSSDMYDASMPGGYSAHADYMEGWDPAIVSTFVSNCDNKAVDCHSHLLGDGRMMFNSAE